jgi:hypothetical protein
MKPRSVVRHDADDATATTARDAREEAQRVVGDGFFARVLEPSPPAVMDDDWFADDPVAAGAPSAAPVVSPGAGADLTWDEWLQDRPEHKPWAAARWLGDHPRLPHPPAALAETTLSFHRLAVYVVSPARRRANGKIALRWTFGGMGTPFFGADEQVRVVGTRLLRQQGDHARVEPITTLAAAADLVLDGPPDVDWADGFDVPTPGDPDDDLGVDAEAATFLGQWYGFAASTLEAVRADRASTDPSRLQLWPEHFDIAFDCLTDDRRATFGVSPGDAAIAQPYIYVLPANFDAVAGSEVWNATSFNGAVLSLSDFVDAPDQRVDALTFFRRCRDALRVEGS